MLPTSSRSSAPPGAVQAWPIPVRRPPTRRLSMASTDVAERRALSNWLVLAAALLVAVGIGYVWIHLQVSETGYRIDAIREAIHRLEQENKDLSAQASTLESRPRLEAEAARRLGMTRLSHRQEQVLR